MRILALAGDVQALICEIRLRVPLQALSLREGWSLRLLSFHECTRADLRLAEVVVVQRGYTRRAWRLQQRAMRYGAAVICEIDDLLTELPAHISNRDAVASRQAWLLRCLQDCDLVSVSTTRLGEALPVSHAFTVPNYACPLGDAAVPAQVPGRPLSLLIASMDRMAGEFIYPALRALAAHQARVVVVGPAAQQYLDAGIAVQAHPLMPRERFVGFARGLENPVALIPLEDSRFASCKSAIKWFEYAEAGIPVICSNVSPYRDVVADGVTGRLVANEGDAWRRALQEVADDSAWRIAAACAAREVVRRHHTLEHTVQAWHSAIGQALDRRRTRASEAPGWATRFSDRLGGAVEHGLLWFRRLNRNRLARRSQDRP